MAHASLTSPTRVPICLGKRIKDQLSFPSNSGTEHSLGHSAEGRADRDNFAQKRNCLQPPPPGRSCLISGDIAEVVLVAGLNYRGGIACGYALSNQQ